MSAHTSGAVVVTGCSSGIGRACALDLAGAGYRVFAGVRTEHSSRLVTRRGAGARAQRGFPTGSSPSGFTCPGSPSTRASLSSWKAPTIVVPSPSAPAWR